MSRNIRSTWPTVSRCSLAAEQQKLAADRKWRERIQRDHVSGKISAFDIARLSGEREEGDPGRVAMLERHVQRLKVQVQDAAELISPAQQRELDPLEEAGRRAHQAFIEATRARLDGIPAPRKQEPRPFDASGDADCTGPDCPVCTAYRSLHEQPSDWLPCRHCGQPADRCGCSLAVR